jgi:hypothetical protein
LVLLGTQNRTLGLHVAAKHRIQFVLLGMQNKTCGPHLSAKHRILIPVLWRPLGGFNGATGIVVTSISEGESRQLH